MATFADPLASLLGTSFAFTARTSRRLNYKTGLSRLAPRCCCSPITFTQQLVYFFSAIGKLPFYYFVPPAGLESMTSLPIADLPLQLRSKMLVWVAALLAISSATAQPDLAGSHTVSNIEARGKELSVVQMIEPRMTRWVSHCLHSFHTCPASPASPH